ncbi:hypothetical protein [Streptomyces sp. SLBN-8D4]
MVTAAGANDHTDDLALHAIRLILDIIEAAVNRRAGRQEHRIVWFG